MFALPIALALFSIVVLSTVELNREAQRRTIEVENEWSCGMLPPEVDAELSTAKLLPQPHLDVCGIEP